MKKKGRDMLGKIHLEGRWVKKFPGLNCSLPDLEMKERKEMREGMHGFEPAFVCGGFEQVDELVRPGVLETKKKSLSKT